MDIFELIVDTIQAVEEFALVFDIQLRHAYMDYFGLHTLVFDFKFLL